MFQKVKCSIHNGKKTQKWRPDEGMRSDMRHTAEDICLLLWTGATLVTQECRSSQIGQDHTIKLSSHNLWKYFASSISPRETEMLSYDFLQAAALK